MVGLPRGLPPTEFLVQHGDFPDPDFGKNTCGALLVNTLGTGQRALHA